MSRPSFRNIYLFWAPLLVALTILPPYATGGTCWGVYDPNHGTCRTIIEASSTQEQCCSNRHHAYTTRTMNMKELFRALVMHPGGISKCIPCSSMDEDICSTIKCSEDRECVRVKGQPRCVCDPDCSDVELDQPVCGSNGVNYSDECHLRMARCRMRSDLEVDYLGYCRDYCEDVNCGRGRRCIEDADGVPRCLNCTAGCFEHEVQGPVCGSDNITYQSQCLLRLTSCASGVAVHKHHSGRCAETTDCSTFRCLEGKVCAMDEEPHCSECHVGDCSSQPVDEICGSDNNTYTNMCSLKRAICHTRRFISRAYHGQCVDTTTSSENIKREFRKYVCRYGYRRGSSVP